MTISLSREEFLQLGVTLGGNWSNIQVERMSSRTRKEKFLDFFYASPKTIKQIFRDIQHQDLGENRIEKPDPCDFLGAFYFLKKYPTKQSQAGFLACSARVALPKAWQYVRAIQALKEKTIKWIFDEDAPINNLDEFFMLTVDGVHCRIHEPRFLPSSGWYSPKFNHAGLSYEIAVSVYHEKICWINGPFPAGQNDMKIFKQGGGPNEKARKNFIENPVGMYCAVYSTVCTVGTRGENM